MMKDLSSRLDAASRARVMGDINAAEAYAVGFAGRQARGLVEHEELRAIARLAACLAAATYDPNAPGGAPSWAYQQPFVRAGVRARIRQEIRARRRGRPSPGPGSAGLDPDRREQLAAHLAALDATARAVLIARFGLDGRPARTVHQAQAETSLSRDWVRRLEAAGLARLRRLYDEDGDDGT